MLGDSHPTSPQLGARLHADPAIPCTKGSIGQFELSMIASVPRNLVPPFLTQDDGNREIS